MSRIDTSIASDKRKRKWIVLSSIVLLALVMASYLAWLFLLKGFTVTVLPAEAAQTQRFTVASGSGFFIENKLYMLGSRAEIEVGDAFNFNSQSPFVVTPNSRQSGESLGLSTDLQHKSSITNPTNMNDIQNDLLFKLYEFLAPADLARLSGTCRKFRKEHEKIGKIVWLKHASSKWGLSENTIKNNISHLDSIQLQNLYPYSSNFINGITCDDHDVVFDATTTSADFV